MQVATVYMIAALFLVSAAHASEQRFVFEKAEMGVPMRITFYAADEAAAKAASEAVFARMEALNAILSDYDPDSEISRLSRSSGQHKAVPVSEPLWRVLEASQRIAQQSDGAFDVTIGPLVNLWRRARRQGELPRSESIVEMKARVGFAKMKLDPTSHTAELTVSEMRLDVGGIAKGFAADEALAILKQRGITRALAALSGDLAAGDPPPGEAGWRVGIQGLDGDAAGEVLLLANQAVSTSGDAYQFVEIGGVRYSHIVDPRTGIGLTGRSTVTVVARDGLTADGLDTTIDLLGPERGLALLRQYPGTEMRMQRLLGEKAMTTESAGWRAISRTAK